MESALRPRDIQARIRAGESPEEVAAAAGTTVDAIMGFAGPVIAERQHVAATALKASVRRRSGESSSAGRTLGEAAELFFGDHSLHDEDVEWDAWRSPDGRWVLTATYAVAGQPRTAEFVHDLPGRYVVAGNDEARILTGELREPESREPAGGRTQARRLSSVPSQDELPLGDDAIELVRDHAPSEEGHEREPAADEPTELADFAADSEATEPLVVDPAADTADADWIASDATSDPIIEEQRDSGPAIDSELDADQPLLEIEGEKSDAGPGADLADEPTAEAAPPKKKSRSSVPSWDEIMFGGKTE